MNFLYVAILILVGLTFVIFYLVARVDKCELKIKQLESAVSQAVDLCNETKDKVDKYRSELFRAKQKAYFQGINKQKRKG